MLVFHQDLEDQDLHSEQQPRQQPGEPVPLQLFAELLLPSSSASTPFGFL